VIGATIPGAKCILAGTYGSGKTHSLGTAVEAFGDGNVFVVFTEANNISVAGPWLDRLGGWSYIPSSPYGWQKLVDTYKFALAFSVEARMKQVASNRTTFTGFMDLLNQMADFNDQLGVSHGDITTWNTDRLLVIDTLSGINRMVRQMFAGYKTNMALSEYGEAQDAIGKFFDQIISMCKCHFILLAHIEYAVDELQGNIQKYLLSTIGKRLAPVLPIPFNDVILAQRQGANFTWITSHDQMDLKANNLPHGIGLKPDWAQVLNGWKKRGGVVVPTTKP
jgi:hypothetical protein